jgi:hypothetical protein
MHVISLNKNKF